MDPRVVLQSACDWARAELGATGVLAGGALQRGDGPAGGEFDLVVLCAAGGAAWALQRRQMAALQPVLDEARRLAAGDLVQPVSTGAAGLVGDVQEALAQLAVNLRALVSETRREVAGVRGDVLDIGPLTTAVLEVGPGQSIHQRTGRKITLPNSVFLTHAVTLALASAAWAAAEALRPTAATA